MALGSHSEEPNPAFAQVDVPLAFTFMLSTRPGKEASVEPFVEGGGYRFMVKVGKPKNVEAAKNGTKLTRANFLCLMSGSPISGDYVKDEGKSGRMGARLMAIVAEGEHGRVYLPPTAAMDAVARQAKPEWKPDVEFFQQALGFRVGNYGMTRWSDLFTPRQLVALTTFSDLVYQACERAKRDALAAGLPGTGARIDSGGEDATAYVDALAVYLSCAVSRMVNYSATLCVWSSHPKDELAKQVFSRQALQMTWDFAETNPFSTVGGTLTVNLNYLEKAVKEPL